MACAAAVSGHLPVSQFLSCGLPICFHVWPPNLLLCLASQPASTTVHLGPVNGHMSHMYVLQQIATECETSCLVGSHVSLAVVLFLVTQPVAHRPPTRQRSKVRSNRSGSRTLDSLAASVASEGGESGSSGEHRHNRGGMSSSFWGNSVCRGGRGGGQQKSMTVGSELWSGVGGHSTAKSAAGILLSMSSSMEQGS